MKAPLHGLVLAGGYSRRMGCDKALLDIHGEPQALWTARLLARVCGRVFVSCRQGQNLGFPDDAGFTSIHDTVEGLGPMGGILEAAQAYPSAAWLVVACDLPRLSAPVLEHLVAQRDPALQATAFISAHDGLPEPLCAVYEPSIIPLLKASSARGRRCPRKLMIRHREQLRLLALPLSIALDNCNYPEDLEPLQ